MPSFPKNHLGSAAGSFPLSWLAEENTITERRSMSLEQRLFGKLSHRSRKRTFLAAAIYVVVVFFIGSLSAIVDTILHPEIPFFDEEHLVVGTTTSLITALLFGAVLLYASRTERALDVHKRDKRLLQQSEEKYRSLFENSKDIVFIETAGGRFEDINSAGVQAFGFETREELLDIDIPYDLFVNFEDWVDRQSMIESDGYAENHEIELKKKDGGHISVLETVTAVYDELGRIVGYRGSMRDVTQQKELEARFHQLQMMESIGRMAAGIAHDFNNFLTTIGGNADLLMKQLPADTRAGDSLREIAHAVEKASALTRQLLLFSRSQPVSMETVEINRLIMDIHDRIPALLGEGVRLRSELCDAPCTAEVDVRNIEQVIMGLIHNAGDAMPDGGDITVSTGKIEIDEEYALAHAEAYPGDFICVSVKDTGLGMDQETLGHIFEPFFGAGHENRRGMGLAVAYGIVMQHGGWIEVESVPGQGSAFRTYLPASTRAARHSETVDANDLRGGGERILLVEDEESVRFTIEKMLRGNGYEVITAENAEQAFDIFVSEAGSIELVFSDIVLPGESGVELAEHLRAHKKALPIILSSGYTDDSGDLRTIQEKDYLFLQKPFSLPDLLKAVKEQLGPISVS